LWHNKEYVGDTLKAEAKSKIKPTKKPIPAQVITKPKDGNPQLNTDKLQKSPKPTLSGLGVPNWEPVERNQQWSATNGT